MDNPDKKVFHYTSLDGLLGITKSASIWATNILYLNDASEFNYAKNLFINELEQFCKVTPGFKEKKVPEESLGYYFFVILKDRINKHFPSQDLGFYVCSFSEKSDLLSQWRGYSKNGSGYSLGFTLNNLQDIVVNRKGLLIRPCIYNQTEQINAIRKLLKKTSDRFVLEVGGLEDGYRNWDTKANYIAADFLLEFVALAPFLKHPKFEEEGEWRIMASLQTKNILGDIKFRPGNAMVVPYIEIPLPMKGERLMIDEVFVGPTNERDLSVASTELLLKSINVACSKVNCSTIPFRPV
jgi:hypothetical protein